MGATIHPPVQARIRGGDGRKYLPLPAVGLTPPKGVGPTAQVARNRGANTTLLASMTLEGMGPCQGVEGSITATVFEAYLKKVLTPSLRHGQSVVVDNLDAHKGERVRELIEERGCQLLYLPAYSPDFNPIEEAFSKIKGLLAKSPSPNP